MVGKATPSVTGYFEIQIKNGPLVWSKKECGTFPTTKEEMLAIYEAIEKEIKKTAAEPESKSSENDKSQDLTKKDEKDEEKKE